MHLVNMSYMCIGHLSNLDPKSPASYASTGARTTGPSLHASSKEPEVTLGTVDAFSNFILDQRTNNASHTRASSYGPAYFIIITNINA